jgi:hypothetical protein
VLAPEAEEILKEKLTKDRVIVAGILLVGFGGSFVKPCILGSQFNENMGSRQLSNHTDSHKRCRRRRLHLC